MLKKVTTEKVDKHQIHLSDKNEWKINRKQSKDIRVNYYLANLLLQTRGQLEGKSTATITRPSSVPLPCELRQLEKQFSMICACTWLGREAAIAECQTPRKAMTRSTSGRVNAGILWKRWSASLMVSTFQYISCESCHGNSDFRFGCKSKPTYLVPHFISKGFRYAEGKRIYAFLFYTVLMIHFCY